MTGHAQRFVNLGIPGLGEAWRVGSGGSAAVFGTRDVNGRPMAVKLLRWAVDPEEAERRFDRERSVLERLGDHPGVVPILGSGITDRGELYFTMPLLQGSMSQVVKQRGAMHWQQAASLMLDVARTIDFAHSNGVLHCDLKPANLLLSAKGRPMVADFGISRVLDATDTATTRMAVSPSYAAPERFRDGAISVRSDVYSLASTYWALVTGRAPFASSSGDDSPEQIMNRVLRRPPEDLASIAQVPKAVAAVISQSMSKDPKDRPHSADAFAEQLRYAVVASGGRVEETITIDVPSDNAWERMPMGAATHEYKSRSGLWWMAAAVLLPLALVVGLIWAVSGSDPDVAVELGSEAAPSVMPATATPATVIPATVSPATVIPATVIPPTATPTPEPALVVFPAQFQTPTPVPPTPPPTSTPTPRPAATATPRPAPTATPRPQPTATARPAPTATSEAQPTAPARPAPTATSEPQPTATPGPDPTATAQPQQACPEGWSGPDASNRCSRRADAVFTPELIVYACPQGTAGNPTPSDPSCQGDGLTQVDAIRTERLACPAGSIDESTSGEVICKSASDVVTYPVPLQIDYEPSLVCQAGSTGSPSAADPNCLDTSGALTPAVSYQPPTEYVCPGGVPVSAGDDCDEIVTPGPAIQPNLLITLQCPDGSTGTPSLADPTCTRSQPTDAAAIVVERTPATFSCPDGFSGTPTAADPFCTRFQPASV